MLRVSASVRFVYSTFRKLKRLGIFDLKAATPDSTPLETPKTKRIKCPRCDKIQTVTLEVKVASINCQEYGIKLVVKA